MSTTTTTQTSTLSLRASTPKTPSGPVEAKLNFFTPPADGSRPFNYVEAAPAGQPQNNFGVATHDVRITDMRGAETSFSLDTHAFQPLPAPPGPPAREADFSSDESIAKTYYPEVERILLSRLPGHPSRVVIFDHTVRRADPQARRGPVQRVHIDQTPASAAQRVRLHVRADEADRILGLGERVRLVNVWRPLNGPVASFPLAVADSRTVPGEKVKGIEHRYPHRSGETAGVEHDAGMRWWYWSGMGNDERLLLQCFDSEGGARVPHTAFEDPRSGEGAKPRESIEVRALVFG